MTEEVAHRSEEVSFSSSDRSAPSKRPSKNALTEDNRIVHGMWIGKRLSSLELLTIHSFLRHGHEFHLWLYDELETKLPKEVVLEDAETILPGSRIIRKREIDKESGVGRGSVAPFSDLFRFKLLYEKGGYWVDMDVACLRPFDFPGPYLFRAHRVGVVNNILKCPRRSRLMRLTFEQVERELDENSSWLLPNRILSRNVVHFKLERFVRAGIWNEDDWLKAIKPLIETDLKIPSHWYAIHWVNEMWRTLSSDQGRYKGRRYVDRVPDKNCVPAQTTLGRLYEHYGLVSNGRASADAKPKLVQARAMIPPQLLAPAKRQPVAPEFPDELHINVLIPSLTLGGAERCVVETFQGLAARRFAGKLFVLSEAEPAYTLGKSDQLRVYRLPQQQMAAKLRNVALEVLASPTPVVFTHLIKAQHLRFLWDWGVTTIPVVHNSKPGWQNEPMCFDHPRVPFVVAVSESVARQLRDENCPRPVITLRHELQRWFSLEDLQKWRREVRRQHAIPDGTLLIGMVGEFKSQKAYTRAVRVLAEIRRHHPAKLIVLGGWDHAWGHGRVAYTAACQQALDLGVIADFLTPGTVRNVEPYYAAFDVFLNTSVYEGLSVAMLEAVQAGCPVVTAEAGGNAERIPPGAVTIKDSSDVAEYVRGIEKVLTVGRRPVPSRPTDADLVPRLWCMLGQYGVPEVFVGREVRTGGLFLTDNLNLGGAARSLVNLLCRIPRQVRPWLGVINETNHQAYFDELDKFGVPVFWLRVARTYVDRVERILQMIRRLGAQTVVFWNVDARVKLLLARILPRNCVRLIDVSPGPWLFQDLANAEVLQRRIALDRSHYFDRIDRFVAKYSAGAPHPLELAPSKLAVIPNGVPDLASTPSDIAKPKLPLDVDPDLVIGTCCRILHSKRIEFLVDMMAELNDRLPHVTLVIVGAASPRYQKYWDSIQERALNLGVSNIHFVGQQADVVSYLRLFRVFVMVATDHGCPNASLEAMSVGLPIVANPNGGTPEQIEHGVNGYLVSDDDPRDMAHRVRILLTNRDMRQRFGEASRRIAREKFSMEKMVDKYLALLRVRGRVSRRAPGDAGAHVQEHHKVLV
jgi:glycosyltransferase involved in cell wall biosynthesis